MRVRGTRSGVTRSGVVLRAAERQRGAGRHSGTAGDEWSRLRDYRSRPRGHGAGRRGAAGGDLVADAEWAWVRCPRAGESPTEFVVLNGRRLRWRGRRLVEADAPVRYV